MHAEAMRAMSTMLAGYTLNDRHDGKPRHLLDVGSYDVNGNYRALAVENHYAYTGLDMRFGPNVDIVSESPYTFPLPSSLFKVVTSGNMLHNVPDPWLLIPEMVRVLKPGGLLAIVTVWQWPKSEYPSDYFRFMPDGLRHLFDLTGRLSEREIVALPDGTLMGSAVKK